MKVSLSLFRPAALKNGRPHLKMRGQEWLAQALAFDDGCFGSRRGVWRRLKQSV